LKTNLARFTGMLQGQRDLSTVGRMLLSELVPLVDAHQGVIYQMDVEGAHLNLLGAYANAEDEGGYPMRLAIGSGFIGQCALEKRRILVTKIPADTCGSASVPAGGAAHACVFPVVFEGQIKAVLALATLADSARAPRS
jgi:GAF domain-containing protein